MKKSLPVIAVSFVAMCIVAIAAILAIKSNNKPDIETDITNGNNSNYYDDYYNYEEPTFNEEPTTSPFEAIVTTTVKVLTDVYKPSEVITTKAPATTNNNVTAAPQTTVPTTTQIQEEEVTVPQLEGVATKPVQDNRDLPQDMTFAGLSKMGYDVIGLKPYIYNNDKEDCFQAEWGYNPFYDWGANLIDFSIETTKLDFKYEDKEYRIQLWKGQYISGEIGTVGGEVGVYNRPKSWTGEHYNCAAEDDWVQMEMTIYWDEFDNGEYLPQFTRNYDDFWWCTGFVDGQLKNRRDSNTMRLLARITWETEEQAELFAEAMRKKGFTEVEDFSPYEIDTFKIYGKDTIFLWQNIR